AVLYAEGRHPHRKVEVPNKGWITVLDFGEPFQIMLGYFGIEPYPGITPMLPQGYLQWKAQKNMAVFPNGSQIAFKSCDSEVDRFEGAKLRWVACDEEPTPEIWDAIKARRIPGEAFDIWLAMTPVNGMTWVYDEFIAEKDKNA